MPSAQYLLVSIVVTMFVELLFLISGVLLTTDSAVMTEAGVEKIFNFNSESEFSNEDIQAWYESSDTVRLVNFRLSRGIFYLLIFSVPHNIDVPRNAGMSKAVFSLQKSPMFQRAVMFAMINPQPNGAGFAGVKTNLSLAGHDGKEGVLLRVRGQGALQHWKVVLTDSEFLGLTKLYTYEAKFAVNLGSEEFQTIELPFSEFKAFYRGQEVPDAPVMDLKKIGAFGLQTFGGVYDEFKQRGAGSLELDFVAVY